MASGSENNESSASPIGILCGIRCKVRFMPTDLELLEYYLLPKASDSPCPAMEFLPQFDVYTKEPWDLKKFRLQGHGLNPRRRNGKYYFFCHKRHHECDGSKHRVRHFVGAGFWECCHHDVKIMDESNSCAGWKNYYAFKLTDKDEETGWIMEEYVLNSSTLGDQKWMVCKIYDHKRRERKSSRTILAAGADSGYRLQSVE